MSKLKLFTPGNGHQMGNRKLACNLFQKINNDTVELETGLYKLNGKIIRVSAYTDKVGAMTRTPSDTGKMPLWTKGCDELHMFMDDGIKIHYYIVNNLKALIALEGRYKSCAVIWDDIKKISSSYIKLGKKQLEELIK